MSLGIVIGVTLGRARVNDFRFGEKTEVKPKRERETRQKNFLQMEHIALDGDVNAIETYLAFNTDHDLCGHRRS